MTTSQSSPVQIDTHQKPLSAPLRLSFDYTRSVGPTLSQFFTALRERRIVGARGSDGRVYVPPAEFDPVTYERLTEIVPVSSVGTVLSWTWQPEPLEGQPLDRPFAWALIKLDGADVPLLHAVDAGSSDAISTGARVHVHWVDEPAGAITDIAYFALGDEAEPVAETTDDREPVTVQVAPSSIEIQHTASLPETAFLRGLEEGKLLGARTGENGKVYFPPKEADPATGLELDNFVELPDRGTVTTFAIINIPFAGPADQAALRRGLRAARRRRYRVPAPDSGDRRHRGADGHAGRGGVEAPRGMGPGHRQHRILQADRRTRRRLRHLQAPPVKGVT